MGDPDRDLTVKAAVREALGIPAEAPLDPRHRSLMRQRILTMAPRAPRVSDRAVTVLGVIGLPGPWLVRAIAAAAVCVGLLAGVVVASAHSLPDEPLYGAKLAAEQLRLAIAVTPQDRAAVEISIADERLYEAERLAAKAVPSSTLLAAGAYAEHVANAAAAIAEADAPEPERAALVAQVEAKIAQQRARVTEVADRLAQDPRTAPAAAALRPVGSTPQATHANAPARIAETAAAVGKRIAAVAAEAEERAKKENAKSENAKSENAKSENAKSENKGQAPAVDRGPGPRETSEKTKESAKKAEESQERAKRAAEKAPSGGPRESDKPAKGNSDGKGNGNGGGKGKGD